MVTRTAGFGCHPEKIVRSSNAGFPSAAVLRAFAAPVLDDTVAAALAAARRAGRGDLLHWDNVLRFVGGRSLFHMLPKVRQLREAKGRQQIANTVVLPVGQTTLHFPAARAAVAAIVSEQEWEALVSQQSHGVRRQLRLLRLLQS